ncbi:SDR family NAD(P)-dependent oxidoreductase [Iodidimonas sp. SYSU 1G8]|uniref:SDR family oxidoreductase n=1 Tax=Iodidimonas sp. SYSU 1G8 TaxID=3133967 RepID=UPI0031FE9232
MREFSGRTAFITGGASGIGLAMARAFADKGMRLVLSDVNKAALDAAESELKPRTDVLVLAQDVTDRAAWAEAVSQVEAFGKLHVVCANAGLPPAGSPVADTDPAKWDRIVAVNLTGVFNTVHYLTPLVRAHGEGGHVVITSSMAGAVAASPIGDYVVTKYGAVGMGEVMRYELAPHNIGVSLLLPGTVGTALSGAPTPGSMNAANVGARVVKAIEGNELYIFTHPEYRPMVEARCNAVLAAFGESAQPGFQEPDKVMEMMRQNAYGAP